MNNKTVFVRTSKGDAEASGETSLLFGEAKRAFMLVNNKSNVDELRKHAAPSLRPQLEEVLEQLQRDEFIRDKDEPEKKPFQSGAGRHMPKMAVPKMSIPPKAPKQEVEEGGDELDFTSPVQPPREEPVAGRTAQAEPAAGELDFSSLIGKPADAGAEREGAEAAARMKAEAEAKAKAEAEARMRTQAEAKARAEAEARKRAEAEAKAKADAEARQRAEAEARAKAEADAKKRAEAEAWAKVEAEAKARKEADAKARARADMEAKMRAEAEAKARAEAEARMRAEAEAKAKARAEMEAKIRAEAEAKARAEAEARLRAEAEARKRSEAEARARAEAEARARAEAEARARAEAEAKARAEAEARIRAEAETRIRAEAEARAKAEAEERSRAAGQLDFSTLLPAPAHDIEAEARRKVEEEARLRAEAEAKVRAEAEVRDRLRAELEAGLRKADEESAARHGTGLEALMKDLSRLASELEKGPAEAPAAAPVARQPAEEPRYAPGNSPQEIEARAAAKLKAEQAAEAARIRAQQEAAAARAKAEEDAARLKQEDEARKLAAEQAKAFAEAEKRAKERAEAEARPQVREREAQPAKRQVAAPPAKAARTRKVRKPVPWLMIGVAVVLLALAAVVALPYVWPMQDYIAAVETELSEQLKQPVHIEGMSAATLPAPRLELKNVTIGNKQEVKVGRVTLFFNVLSLPADIKAINKAEATDVTISADSFSKALPWFRATASNARFPVTQLVLHNVRAIGDVPAIPALGGNVEFDATGRFTQANLKSEDGKLGVMLQPQDGNLQLDLSLKDTSLPLVPNIQFGYLDATGMVGNGVINFTAISGSLYGGTLKGSANLAWQGGWQLQGRLNVHAMQVDKALPGLKVTGEMDGEGNLFLGAQKLSQLVSAPRLDGSVHMAEGAINAVDIGETARSTRRQPMTGITHFDSMSGTLSVDSAGNHLRQIRITSGAMSISGSADVAADGRLTGQLNADMNRVRAGMGTLPLMLGGSVADPVWSVGR